MSQFYHSLFQLHIRNKKYCNMKIIFPSTPWVQHLVRNRKSGGKRQKNWESFLFHCPPASWAPNKTRGMWAKDEISNFNVYNLHNWTLAELYRPAKPRSEIGFSPHDHQVLRYFMQKLSVYFFERNYLMLLLSCFHIIKLNIKHLEWNQ